MLGTEPVGVIIQLLNPLNRLAVDVLCPALDDSAQRVVLVGVGFRNGAAGVLDVLPCKLTLGGGAGAPPY